MTDKPKWMPEPVAWTLTNELHGETTCSAHLWKVNPQNSSWASLFTADQLAAVRRDALDAAYDAMFSIKGDKETRFDAQTAIRALKEQP